jgi:hypothetical protein
MREGSDRHVVAAVAELSRFIVPRCNHDLISRLSVRVTDWTFGMVVVDLVLGTLPVLHVVAFAIFALHDPMDGDRGAVLTIIVEATSKLSLLTLAVALVDVATSVVTMSVLVDVGA